MEHFRPDTLKAFFEGKISTEGLARQIKKVDLQPGQAGPDAIRDDLKENFTVTADHLVLLCDAVLDGEIEPSHLQRIGSVLVSSERFLWNLGNIPTDLINEVIHAWDTPDINYRLTTESVGKFRTLLRTGENNFNDTDRSDTTK